MRYAIYVVCVLLMAGCGQRPVGYTNSTFQNSEAATVENPYGLSAQLYTGAPAPPPPPAFAASQAAPRGDAFAYSHAIRIEMQRATIRPRFERARDRCLQDTTISCTLVAASINIDENTNYPSSYAQLVVLLPHDKVDPFADSLLQPLNGESAGSAQLRSRSTQAGNVTKQAADVGRRLTQLTDYRDRLTALSRRADAKVDELIKLASELSTAQSNVEQWAAQQRDVSERVAKERLTISLSERPGVGDAMRPMLLAGSAAIETFSASAATALSFVIWSIPWLPILALAFFVLSRLWNFTRRRRAAAAAPVPVP